MQAKLAFIDFVLHGLMHVLFKKSLGLQAKPAMIRDIFTEILAYNRTI